MYLFIIRNSKSTRDRRIDDFDNMTSYFIISIEGTTLVQHDLRYMMPCNWFSSLTIFHNHDYEIMQTT